jgi:uncharacterized membrane protein
MIPNSEITASARAALSGKWTNAVLATLVWLIVNIVSQILPIVGPIICIAIGGAMALGIYVMGLKIARGETMEIGDIFSGFNKMLPAFCLYWLMFIFIFLWALLLIIPGILAAFSYSMAWFIKLDHPELGANACLDLSKKMMYGYRWKYFCLLLRFIGWAILCVFTLGIGILWLYPYMMTSMAKFYEDVAAQYASKPAA